MIEPKNLKVCSKCGDPKTLDLYPFNRRRAKHAAACKACKLIQTNEWRNRNKDKVNAMARARSSKPQYLTNGRHRSQRWRQRHPDKKKTDNLRWTERRRERRASLKQLSEDRLNCAGPSQSI